MKVRIIVALSCLSLLAGIFFSCEEDIDVNPAVVTEDVIFASGERFRISGRIITNQRINALDHGFVIADNPSFNQSLTISLGERQDPGRFIGEITGLNIDTQYFVKAFVDLGGETLSGNVLEVQTLSPAAFSIQPNNGPTGSVVTIQGKNFTRDTEVFFGAVKAEVIDINFESILRVRVPAIGAEPVVPIRIINQGRETVLEERFSFRIGKFTLIAPFPSAVRVFDGIALQEGNTFYFGKGTDRGQNINSNFWRFQVGEANWSPVDFPLESFWRGFVSGSFIGGGFDAIVNPQSRSDFYQLQNGTFLKQNDLPFNVTDAVAFELNGFLYLAGGSLGMEIRKYLPVEGTWESVGSIPFTIERTMLHFSHGNRQYFVNPENNEIHAFNASTEDWSFVSAFPGNLGNGRGVAIAIGDKAYLGIGNRSPQMWELDLNNGNWLRKNDFPGSTTSRTEGVFLWEEKIYFVRSAEVQIFGEPSEFWVFEPDSF
ncbi:MAG: IPT/TIG domain-containing protein [Cecembia sp.]